MRFAGVSEHLMPLDFGYWPPCAPLRRFCIRNNERAVTYPTCELVSRAGVRP
jgi:hypothetical protein